ncbi:hypothetical protein BC941DRAFT_341472 [Chlamydoabsidia padenii]|nr:hypothetical protein BC941DRAFT_341472 [Chlamydoabsidia padenii]
MNTFLILGLFFILFNQVIQAKSSVITPRTDFRSPKIIGFAAVGGGSSHYHWVLEILQDLHTRGHQTTMYTRGDSIRFADDYPDIQTRAIGGDLNFLAKRTKQADPRNYTQHMLPKYLEFEKIIKDEKVDMMLCDLFALACIDATTKAEIPLVITSTLSYTPDTSTSYVNTVVPSLGHPTIETMTIWERLHHHFNTWYIPFQISRLGLPAHAFQKQRGLFPMTDLYHHGNTNHAFKLINNMFGIEPARPMGPLAEMVGPILRPHYANLSTDLADFLATHRRVAYVAFGQHAVPTEKDTEFLARSLTHQVDLGILDGILWATMASHPTPQSTLSSSMLVTGWAPQFAVLQHPSVVLFVTHGGAGSVHESLFSKVPLFVYPFFGDQPLTARMVRRQRIGEAINTAGMVYSDATYYDLNERIHRVLTDPVIRRNVDHYGHIVQIRSLHAVQRGADLLEEILFGAIDGMISHRVDVGDSIVWYKKMYLDLIVIVWFGMLGLVWSGSKLICQLQLSKKLKTL